MKRFLYSLNEISPRGFIQNEIVKSPIMPDKSVSVPGLSCRVR